ncbi:transposase [Microcoleus sp. BR0-C5]|uniref:transposase n=1 Tax=Microcoleus sp. BR0-C5 TaxID=2818713 RepID=UPI004040B93D
MTPSSPETSLRPTLATAQVVVMENLTFDKSRQIQELIQTAGCRLLYLPQYSPEFNKIEQRRVLAKKSNS